MQMERPKIPLLRDLEKIPEHAETLYVKYDANKISLQEIMDHFFRIMRSYDFSIDKEMISDTNIRELVYIQIVMRYTGR